MCVGVERVLERGRGAGRSCPKQQQRAAIVWKHVLATLICCASDIIGSITERIVCDAMP